MKVLVLNSGSSTLKYQLFETSLELMAGNEDRMLARGIVDRIGEAVADHAEAVAIALQQLTEAGRGAVGKLEEIQAVGHRIVHGGEYFSQPVRMDDSVVERIRECAVLAPLHNPPNLSTYEACRERMPAAVHVAVFDTAFHQTLAPAAYTYGLPYEVCARYKVRRYGFHGTSHRYVALRFAQIQRRPLEEFKIVTCHLGNGCSMCAIERGRSIDTSMGLTPLEGLLMGTRAGDTDLGAALYLMQWEGLNAGQMDALLNHSSGLAGISGVSNDMRTLLESARQGNPRARLAIDVFCYRIRKYIGAYFAALNGVDAVIFTAGIGENAPAIRAQACESLEALGIRIDPARNASARGVEAEISAADAATRVWVIPTNEELLIGRDTVRCIQAR
jgi:acetate kinase